MMNSVQLILSAAAPAVQMRFNEPMRRHTSFAIGGPADVLVEPGSLAELVVVLQTVHAKNIPYVIIGGGTNILVSDRGIRGVVIHTSHLAEISVQGTHLIALAGATVEAICNSAEQASLGGLEFLYGLPGAIGGAVWMNARCYGRSIADVVEQVVVIGRDYKLETLRPAESDFGYKRSPFQAMDACIWEVTFRLEYAERLRIREQMQRYQDDRILKGHYTAPSAGSVFKNNPDFGAPTGKILDELGLRGTVVGGAAIASYHGNIFINQEDATAADVLALIRLAMTTAAREKNIQLEPEIRFVGDWQSEELVFLGEKPTA